ncbi:hypothetical protein [Ruminiclostridium sufflavum]|uniref:hypothetical protein n=1 Tax=Ruminiclostridium sufflavum TaxID=396504 RepID=UPI000D7BDD29|nr:hypothetical protein [Ruminiclostridium sufflavum]
MKTFFLKRKIFAQLLLICFLAFFINSTEAAETTNTSIIKLDGWSLEDTYSISYGEGKFTTYTYSDFQGMYNKNCTDEQINDLSLENNSLQYQQYCLQYDSICDSIAEYRQLSEKYNALARVYEDEMNAAAGAQKDTARQGMQQSLLTAKAYEAELAAAVLKKADIYVSRENSLFIKNNEGTIRNQQYVSQTTDFRNFVYELKMLDEKYDLQGIYADYAKLQEDEQSINKSKDMAFQADVDFYSSDYDYYINQQKLVKQQYNNQFEQLLSSSGISPETQGTVIKTNIEAIKGIRLISYETLESSIKLTDIKEMQLDDKYRIIDGKIKILKEYYSDTSGEVRLAQNEKIQTSMERNKWVIQRKNILKNAHALYRSKYYEIGINEKKAKALHDKYIILLNKYNFGLTDKITVKEAELSYMQGKFNLWNTIFEYAGYYSTVEKYISGNIQ